MIQSGSEFLGLSDLLENDLTSYEYFNSLPPSAQRRLEQMDVRSFEQLQRCANKM